MAKESSRILIVETQEDKSWRVPRSSDENDEFATLCQSHFCGIEEAERRWWLVETRTGGEEGKGEEEDVTFITCKQLG